MDRPARQNLVRLEQVVAALLRHGLDASVARMQLAGCMSIRCRIQMAWAALRGDGELTEPWAYAVRDALVDLGPAFVKAGQILSVRADLVPEELAQALRTLQDDVPPVSYAEIRRVAELELGMPIENVFRWFSPAPIAAASIAQVHAAELLDGTPVAVKIKRPMIDARVARDLDLMVWLAQRLERTWPASRRYHPRKAAEEVRRYTLRELDFRSEARVMTRLGHCFAHWPDVVVPHVHQATPGLLIMERVICFPIDDLEKLHAHGIDVPQLVQTAVNAMLAQIYDFGLFHGDPHPGNLQVDLEGRLVLLDFGIYGELSDRIKRNLALSAIRLAEGELDLATGLLLKVGTLQRGADPRGFREAVRDLYQAWRGATEQQYGFGRLVYDQMTAAARYGIEFPPDAIVFAKALLTLEGVALRLAPDMELSRQAEPYLRSLRWKYLAPGRWLVAAEETLPLWLDLAEELPFAGEQLMERLTARPRDEEASTKGWARAVFPGLTVLSGAVMMAGAVPPTWGGVSVLGFALMGIGLALGAHAARTPP